MIFIFVDFRIQSCRLHLQLNSVSVVVATTAGKLDTCRQFFPSKRTLSIVLAVAIASRHHHQAGNFWSIPRKFIKVILFNLVLLRLVNNFSSNYDQILIYYVNVLNLLSLVIESGDRLLQKKNTASSDQFSQSNIKITSDVYSLSGSVINNFVCRC